MSVDVLLERLPGHFNKSKDSNNYKLLSLVAKESEDNQALYDTIHRFWDVDQSEGVGLDRLGKDEGISRGSWDDEEYRKMIKVQHIVNFSQGDIKSINTVLSAYLGDSYIGLEEGWENHSEPASFFVNIKPTGANFPFSLLRRIKPAGVRMEVVIEIYLGLIKLIDDTYSYPVFYPLTGQFWGKKESIYMTDGNLKVIDDTYDYIKKYPVTKQGFSQLEDKKTAMIDDTYSYEKPYRKTGEMMPLKKEVHVIEGISTLTDNSYSFEKKYRLCGQFAVGG